MTAAAIIVAAGRGERAGNSDKVLQPLAGQSVLARAVAPFVEDPRIVLLVLVAPAGREAEYRAAAFAGLEGGEPPASRLTVTVVPGGARRQDSVARGLSAVPDDVDLVAVHDAARPLCTPSLLARLLDTASVEGAAVPVVPPADTIIQVSQDGAAWVGGLDRARLRAVQTPQVFRRDWLVEAHALADAEGADVTDDGSLIRRLGHPVAAVEGLTDNIKITLASDIDLAAALLRRREEA